MHDAASRVLRRVHGWGLAGVIGLMLSLMLGPAQAQSPAPAPDSTATAPRYAFLTLAVYGYDQGKRMTAKVISDIIELPPGEQIPKRFNLRVYLNNEGRAVNRDASVDASMDFVWAAAELVNAHVHRLPRRERYGYIGISLHPNSADKLKVEETDLAGVQQLRRAELADAERMRQMLADEKDYLYFELPGAWYGTAVKPAVAAQSAQAKAPAASAPPATPGTAAKGAGANANAGTNASTNANAAPPRLAILTATPAASSPAAVSPPAKPASAPSADDFVPPALRPHTPPADSKDRTADGQQLYPFNRTYGYGGSFPTKTREAAIQQAEEERLNRERVHMGFTASWKVVEVLPPECRESFTGLVHGHLCVIRVRYEGMSLLNPNPSKSSGKGVAR